MIVLVSNFLAALPILLFAGLAWTAVISTLIAELQLFLPVWVRARGIAIYLVTFTGSMTVGALIWGLVAEGVGLQLTFFTAAVDAWWSRRWAVLACARDRPLDSEPAIYWPEARLAFDPGLDTGPVLVTVEYIVAPDREEAFWTRWTAWNSLDVEPARRAGSCTEMVIDQTTSSSSSASRHGRSTSASTRAV